MIYGRLTSYPLQLERTNRSIYSGGKTRRPFQSASSWRESTGRAESLSERTDKERERTASALQFLGNRRPISARAKSNLPIRRSRAHPPAIRPPSRSTAETDVAREIARLCILPPPPPPILSAPFRCRIFFLLSCGIEISPRSFCRSIYTIHVYIYLSPSFVIRHTRLIK